MTTYTRLSRRTVQRSLRSLEELGLIRKGNTRVRDARIERADWRPEVYDLALSAGTAARRQDGTPLTSTGRRLSTNGASGATRRGVSTTPEPSFNRPMNRPAPSAPGRRSAVSPECGQCDARPDDP